MLLIISSVLSHAYPRPIGCINRRFCLFPPTKYFLYSLIHTVERIRYRATMSLLMFSHHLIPAVAIPRFVANPTSLLIAATPVHPQNLSNDR